MPGGPELAADTRGRQLPKQVLVEIALGVALGQRQLVDHVDRFDQKARLLNHELRVLHELGKGRTACRRGLEMGKDLVANQGKHFVGANVAEPRPPQVLLVALEAPLE